MFQYNSVIGVMLLAYVSKHPIVFFFFLSSFLGSIQFLSQQREPISHQHISSISFIHLALCDQDSKEKKGTKAY